MDPSYYFFEHFPPKNIYIISPNVNYDSSIKDFVDELKKDEDFNEE